jgi:glyoxylase I family protein
MVAACITFPCYAGNIYLRHMFNKIHHVAIICSDYARSKEFYVKVLGLTIVAEVYREERQSYKLDLAINEHYQIELFSFEQVPARPSRPEAAGLRHLAFEVEDLDQVILTLTSRGVATEAVRIDEFTGKRFTFFADPDGLPLELYER